MLFFKKLIRKKVFFFSTGFILGVFFSYLYPVLSASYKLAIHTETNLPLSEKKVVIVLGSGGIRGLAHIGVLEELEKNNIPISQIIGCSAGSLIGGFYAASKNLEYLKTIFFPLNRKDLVDFHLFPEKYLKS